MSFALDPIVSNILLSLSLIPHLSPARAPEVEAGLDWDIEPPFLSVVLAFYHEKPDDVDITISSVVKQTYPRDRYEVILVAEPGDEETIAILRQRKEELLADGYATQIVVSDGSVTSKPHALNVAITHVRGDYCVFYDASDSIDSEQFAKGVTALAKGYDVAQARVVRVGPSLVSRLLLWDTLVWFWKFVPLLLRFCGAFPLSGEGLFIRREVLLEAGGFPEVLTEDAYLGMILAQRNKRFALLDSTVAEKAPAHLKSHFRQKLRWHRGYLTCLRELFSRKMGLRQKAGFFLPFCMPVASASAFVGWLVLALAMISTVFPGHERIGIIGPAIPVYRTVVGWWAIILACVGIPLGATSVIHASRLAGMREHLNLILLLPIYWLFVGFCSFCSFFRNTSVWGKTER